MTLKNLYGVSKLSDEQILNLKSAATRARINAITMVQAADSGHPAGAFSGIEIFLSVYALANLTPNNCDNLNRDNIIISHGHTSPGVYAVLAEFGFIDALEAVKNFRRCGSVFQGHVVREIPGIDWDTGNLGQGLSAGVGYALAQRARNFKNNVFVVMGDGAQTKGQLAEARRIAINENLNNIIALIDNNDIQICGHLDEIMKINLKEVWRADGWNVLECDGHNFNELFNAINQAKNFKNSPTVIICKTLMGKDGCAMEGTNEYHGKAPGEKIYFDIIKNLKGDENLLNTALEARKNNLPQKYFGREIKPITPNIETGNVITYEPNIKTDNRSAFGKALAQIGKLNYKNPDKTPILVFDCDLMPSVKTDEFKKYCPENFVQCGIQEHATATISGAASAGGVISLWADFGVFGIDEVYNQHRLNDINNAGNKLVLTHTGLDVGEDGATHQCIDYIGLMRNMFGWKIIVPADPNQTDRATRYMLKTPGCICLAMGRSKREVIKEFADDNFKFEYGKAIKLRSGNSGSIFALGYMTQIALKAADKLSSEKNINLNVYCVSSPLAPDLNAIREACNTKFILTVEDHNINTGMASIMALEMMKNNLHAEKFKNLGPDNFGPSGSSSDVRKLFGLSVDGIINAVNELI